MRWGLCCATAVGVLSVSVSVSAKGEDSRTQRFQDATAKTEAGVLEEIADNRHPGSLLIYPEFDNIDGMVSVFTLTNVNDDASEEIQVEFVYLDKFDCSEFNRVETLTANDTITLLTAVHNPQHERGYAYAFARQGSTPVVWNSLIGSLLIIDGIETFEYSVNALTYAGVGSESGVVQPDGTATDLDGDGHRDLDGKEYALSPAEILVPRFLGQYEEGQGSELILIGLTGGAAFTTTVDFLIYNDNEEVFSSEYTFSCWWKPTLLEISGIFSNEFLSLYTNHDPQETLGAEDLESGWFRIDGAVANSTAESIEDPAFYAVLIERIPNNYAAADLPFSTGGQDNGSLLPRGVNGDGDPTPENGDNQ